MNIKTITGNHQQTFPQGPPFLHFFPLPPHNSRKIHIPPPPRDEKLQKIQGPGDFASPRSALRLAEAAAPPRGRSPAPWPPPPPASERSPIRWRRGRDRAAAVARGQRREKNGGVCGFFFFFFSQPKRTGGSLFHQKGTVLEVRKNQRVIGFVKFLGGGVFGGLHFSFSFCLLFFGFLQVEIWGFSKC